MLMPPSETAAEVTTQALSLALVFSWIGFAAPLPLVVTGYVFALVGGFVGLAALPVEEVHPNTTREIAKTILFAVFVGTLVGVAQPRLGDVWQRLEPAASPDLLPWTMGLAGVISRFVAKRLVRGDFSLPKFGRSGGQP